MMHDSLVVIHGRLYLSDVPMHPSKVQRTEILVIAVVDDCAVDIDDCVDLGIELGLEPIRIEIQPPYMGQFIHSTYPV